MRGEPTHSGRAVARQVATVSGSMLPITYVGWSTAPAGAARGVRIARGVPAPLPPLSPGDARPEAAAPGSARRGEARVRVSALRHAVRLEDGAARPQGAVARRDERTRASRAPPAERRLRRRDGERHADRRSEEHTSELQSPM